LVLAQKSQFAELIKSKK